MFGQDRTRVAKWGGVATDNGDAVGGNLSRRGSRVTRQSRGRVLGSIRRLYHVVASTRLGISLLASSRAGSSRVGNQSPLRIDRGVTWVLC